MYLIIGIWLHTSCGYTTLAHDALGIFHTQPGSIHSTTHFKLFLSLAHGATLWHHATRPGVNRPYIVFQALNMSLHWCHGSHPPHRKLQGSPVYFSLEGSTH